SSVSEPWQRPSVSKRAHWMGDSAIAASSRGERGGAAGGCPGAGARAGGPGGGWRLQLGEVALAGLDVDLARRRFAVRRAAFEGGELVQAKGREEAGSAPPSGWTGSVKALEGRSLLLRSEA